MGCALIECTALRNIETCIIETCLQYISNVYSKSRSRADLLLHTQDKTCINYYYNNDITEMTPVGSRFSMYYIYCGHHPLSDTQDTDLSYWCHAPVKEKTRPKTATVIWWWQEEKIECHKGRRARWHLPLYIPPPRWGVIPTSVGQTCLFWCPLKENYVDSTYTNYFPAIWTYNNESRYRFDTEDVGDSIGHIIIHRVADIFFLKQLHLEASFAYKSIPGYRRFALYLYASIVERISIYFSVLYFFFLSFCRFPFHRCLFLFTCNRPLSIVVGPGIYFLAIIYA